MIEIFLKNAKGLWEPEGVTEGDLVNWFEKNIDDLGNVLTDIVVTTDFVTKVDTDGIRFMLSDMGLDRDFERIDPAGWNLKQFKTNPIILWSHDQFRPAIGKMEDVKVKGGELVGTAIFAPKEIDEFAWSIGEKIKAGFISAGSVGFKSKRVEILDKSKDGTRLIHREQDLYEYSIVNIPSLASSGVRKDVDNVQVKAHNEFDKDFWTSAKPADDLSLVFGRGLLKQIWEE